MQRQSSTPSYAGPALNKTWPTAPLSSVVKLELDRVSVQPDVSYELAGVYNEGRGLFVRDSVRGEDMTYASLTRLHADQAVMRKLTAWEGTLAVVPADFEGRFVSSEFPTFTLTEQILPSYLRVIFQQPWFWHQLRLRATGTVQRRKRVNPEQLLQIEIPLPPIAEQLRISEVAVSLENNLSAIGDYAEAARTFKQTLVNSIADRQLVDEGIEASVADVAAEVRSRTNDPSTSGVERYVGLEHFDKGSFQISRFGSPADVTSAKTIFEPNDVLFGKLRPYLRKVAITQWPGLCSTDVLAFRPDPRVIIPAYLAVLLSSDHAIDYAVSTSRGTRMPRTSFQAMSEMKILLPSIEVQQRMVEVILAVDRTRDELMEVRRRTIRAQGEIVSVLLTGEHEIPRATSREVAS